MKVQFNNISYNQQKNSYNTFKAYAPLNDYFRGYPKRIKYTWQHKKAYLEMERKLTGGNTFRGYLHDLDKLIMYVLGFPKKLAHNIHVALSSHHIRNNSVKHPEDAVIDWECARSTKPDKPYTARQYYEKFCPKIPEIEEALNKFNL